MATSDDLPRRPLATYRRTRSVEDEETVPDSEDSISHGQSRPLADDGGTPTSSPIKPAQSPPRPPRAVYRSRKHAPSPPPLSYSSMAPAEEVIPDSEDNSRNVGTSDDDADDDDNEKKSPSDACQSLGISDWKQKLRAIDDQYDADERTQGPHEISRTVPDPKEAFLEDPFGSPLTTETSSQHAPCRLRADESLSSPSRLVSSSTNTTPHFLFGTPRTPSPSPPTSDGKPSPMSKTRTKGKGKAREHTKAHEAVIDDKFASSPNVVRQKRRSERHKKPKAPTKKELLEARRETARLRSDMRASISTDATRPLDIKMLLKRFDVNQPAPSTRPLQLQSSGSEIEAWTSSSPTSARDLEQSGTHQDDGNETPQHKLHMPGRRTASPFHSPNPMAPMSKYKVASAADCDEDDPFRVTTSSSAPKETGMDRDADSGSGSDVEMPGIGEILAEKEARESLRTQKERLQQLKLVAIARQQKTASTSAGSPPGAEHDSDDDGLDVVPDTMHSVAREEAAARAAAGRTRPSASRTIQLRFARVAASPQRGGMHPFIPATNESPEKLMAAAAQPTFLSSLARGNGAAAGRGKRNAGMTKADLEQMVLRSAEAQSEQLRREKEEEWVRRGGRVVGIMEDVGEEKVQELIGEALEHDEHTPAQGDGAGGDDDDDEDDDGDYNPIERGSASPLQEQGEQDEVAMPIEEKRAYGDEHPDDDDDGIDEAAAQAATEVDSEAESGAPNNARLRRRTARARHAIVGSDDEDGPPAVEPANDPPPLSLPDFPSPAFTSMASPWPSGNAEPIDHDHENDPDVSGNDTDKENRAVVRHGGPPSTHGARVLFDDILSARGGMGSAMQPSVLLTDDDPFAFTPSPAKAQEQALRRLGSPAPRYFGGKRGLSQMFEEEEGDSLAPVPALMIQGVDGERATPSGTDPGLVGFKPVLGGLSQAFEQTQDASGSGPGMGGLAALRRGADAELSLTFEAQAAALQPALEVDDHLRARAAAIFEKEQEYVLEAAQPAASRSARRELYITENGFLTQTRPEGSSPLVYRPSPSQRPYDAFLRSQSARTLGTAPGSGTGTGTAASSPLVTRQPLSTLAETSPMSSVGREPLRRLRRAHTSPDTPAPAPASASPRRYGYPRGQSLSPSPSPSRVKAKGAAAAGGKERTAFELMMGAAAQRDNGKAKMKRSEFVEDQAVESDEEDMLGFGGMRKKGGNDDEEEDDEKDADGVVKALVNDAHMDDTELAKSKVLEKHLEQQTADDARLEKEVQDVVAGKRRVRRRAGAGGLLGSDGSEDDEDDEEARALRQRLAKKRRVAGDTLDALARDPAMASFHATYQMALVDDAEEFAHLDRDQELDSEPELDRDRDDGEGGDGDGDGADRGFERGEGNRRRKRGGGEEQEEDEDVEMAESSTGAGKGKGEISAAEVRRALQEVARGEREYHALDPEDVSWMDQDLDETDEAETLRVRLASSNTSKSKATSRAHIHPADADMDVFSLNRIHADEQQDSAYAQRMKRWANEEGAASRHGTAGGGRRTGTGMAVAAGAAVTGHRPRGSAAAAKSVKKAASSAAPTAAPVRKTASVLSAVADRRGRFGA